MIAGKNPYSVAVQKPFLSAVIFNCFHIAAGYGLIKQKFLRRLPVLHLIELVFCFQEIPFVLISHRIFSVPVCNFSNFCVSFKVYLKMRMASILFYKDIGSTSFSNEHRFCRTFLRLLKTQMNYGGDTEKDYMRYT